MSEPIRYTVRFPNPQTHYAEVEAVMPSEGKSEIEVFLPVWTPGSYLIREYARNLEDFRATDESGKKLVWEKSRKNRWRIQTGGAARITLAYRLYCREMSVRTNWVEDKFALLNGAPTFASLVGGSDREHLVKLELPEAWRTSFTGLEEAADASDPHFYRAPDYDTLVDSPIVAGNSEVVRFEVDGIPHFLVNEGDFSLWNASQAAGDLEQLVRRIREMWGANLENEQPYQKYLFLNMVVESYGGLEHKNSTCLMSSRTAMRTRQAYTGWLGLASHEYFHAWNVKRLRPVELGPFDYENENYTAALWIAEGFTEYYGELMMKRAGLIDESEYLGSLSGLIQKLQTTPGRLVQSVAGSSYDAWIKLYRPDENSGNSTISYYTKGAVIGWLLDAKIRSATGGERSLDDVMRAAFGRFGGERGFTQSEFTTLAESVAAMPLADFFEAAVEGVGELDYGEALTWFGLRWKEWIPSKKAFLGAETKASDGRLLITRISRDSPAYESGLSVDDEILAMDNLRIRPDTLAQRLEQHQAGNRVSLVISRRERLISIDLQLAGEPRPWQLEMDPQRTAEQQTQLSAWLDGK